MKIFKNKHKLLKEILYIKNISFVPTMGGFHKGHLSLIKKAQSYNGKTLVSIFVNPKQFNNKKDFINYPRNNKNDLKILRNLSVDYVYLPKYKDVFSFIPKKKIYLHSFSKELCGRYRKGHFKGVLNVVNRLIETIKPKYLILGLKDFQQLQLIKEHFKTRKINSIVVPCKTIREKNGVACSTRNFNIDKEQLNIASKIYLFLKNKKKMYKKKLSNFNSKKVIKELKNLGSSKIDYIELYNLNTLQKPKNRKEKFKIFIAYYLNKTRLIDNI